MGKIQVLAIVGGISKNSLNKKLYKAFLKRKPLEVEMTDFDISQLPFFSQDIEMDPPAAVKNFKEQVQNCDAVLFVTPEYNHSLPGVLKNAIDWGSRPPKQGVWDNKVAGVVGASMGAMGSYASQLHLRQILGSLNIHVMMKPEFYMASGSKLFNEDGELNDEKTAEYIQKYWAAFAEWVGQNK